MSDWYGHSRSNYFQVKDVEKFKEFLSKWSAEYIDSESEELSQRCQRCKNGNPDKKCDKYVAGIIGACDGEMEKIVLHGFLGEDDKGALPHYYYDEVTGVDYEFDDFIKELQSHLVDGWVVIMIEVGAEKLAHVSGFAMALNSKGESKEIVLADITDIAKTLGSHVTLCEC